MRLKKSKLKNSLSLKIVKYSFLLSLFPFLNSKTDEKKLHINVAEWVHCILAASMESHKLEKMKNVFINVMLKY